MTGKPFISLSLFAKYVLPAPGQPMTNILFMLIILMILDKKLKYLTRQGRKNWLYY